MLLFFLEETRTLPLNPLLLALPRFAQIVAHNTQGEKIIDVLIMSCPELYTVPLGTPPVLPDDPHHAAPSDHRVPMARPLALAPEAVTNVYREKVYRPLPDSMVRVFMKWILSEAWDMIPVDGSPTEQVEIFQEIVDLKVKEMFPQKKVRISNKDKVFITSELKTLDKRKKREWRKNGKSERYLQMKTEFTLKYKKAARDHISKCVTDLRTENAGKAAATLRRLGAQPGGTARERGGLSLSSTTSRRD
jgi:hypothetical protein